MSALRIAPMTLEHLGIAVDWAAAEGWNPGLEDAETFHAIDPDGFLMGWLGERPATAISVVSHGPEFGFLGFYLCDPALRGQGFGLATWQAGLARLGGRTVGLDGVVAQEANYRRSGFAFAFRTHRYEGTVDGRAHPDCLAAGVADLEEMIALDAAANGVERRAYMTAWLDRTRTRQTMVRRKAGRIEAMGSIRSCRSGHKIGPLIAPDTDTAIALIESLCAAAGARRIAIDIPEISQPGRAIPATLGLDSAFACARMYKGPGPEADPARLIALASPELG